MSEKSPRHRLIRHPRGAWYKWINGRSVMVAGAREARTGEEADRVYESKFAALWGQNSTSVRVVSNVAIADLFDQFIAAKRIQNATGNLHPRTLEEYVESLQSFVDIAGSGTRFDELTPYVFTVVYQTWSGRFGPFRLSKFISNTRTCFNWLHRNGFIDHVPQYGDLRQPDRAAFRRHRAALELEADTSKPFTAKQIALLLDESDPPMRAAILLALNGGFGNTDLSSLRLKFIDLSRGWIDYARVKTGVNRRCPLWPETIEAITKAKRYCRIAGNLFSTSDGMPLVQGKHDRLAIRFKILCETVKCYVEGRGFYSLRHLFTTTATQHGPTILVKRITGHVSDEEDRVLDEHYVGNVDKALCEMVDSVRHDLISEWCGALLGVKLPAIAALRSSRRP